MTIHGHRTTLPARRIPSGGGVLHVHVYSVFGDWCYLCGQEKREKRWWGFWEKWIEDDHDEPF